MKQLEYPFDSSYIIRKKKQIKQEILNNNKNFIEKKIAIMCGSTANELMDLLELFLLNNGIKPIFYLSEYNRFYEEIVFDNKKLDDFNPDIIYIYTSFRNIRENIFLSDTEKIIESKLDNEYGKYHTIWETINKKYRSIIIQNNFEYPNYRLLGNKDISDIHGFSNFINKLNLKFYDYANKNNNFFICDINYISSDFGLSNWHDEKMYSFYKYMCSLKAIPYIAFNISNIIKSVYGKNKKAFALDLDNTLWGGIISEDGIDGISVNQETPVGELYLAFQNYIKKHKELGIILNIVSKNDENMAIEGLDKSDGILKTSDFINIKSNFSPKNENILEIAKELNIGVDSFVFVDDNPFERAIVENSFDGISVPNVENIEDYIKVLDRNGYFEVTNFTSEDLSKVELYKENIKRKSEEKKFSSYSEFLKSLDMKAKISHFDKKYYNRISQLTNKSNQFNLTTKRYSVEDIDNISSNENYITLYGKLTDKFGDNGIVSLLIGKIDGEILNIDLFLMSCRVLKRDMEFAMLDELVKVSKKRQIKKIIGFYYKTEKNNMVSNLYLDFGFVKVHEDNGDTVWELNNLDEYINKNKYISIV